MVTAIVLLNVRRDAINETAGKLLEISGVTEVYSCAGQWDLVAMVRARDNEQLAGIVTDHMLKVESITRSETLITFRAFSKYDLEMMFDIGLD